MVDVIRMRALDGSLVEFHDKIVGSGQKKDCYFSPQRDYVVLWYRDPVSAQDLSRLEAITGSYREQLFNGPAGPYWRELMCWPDRIVRHGERVGITAPAYSRRYFFEYGSLNNDALKLRGKEKEGYWFASLKHRAKTLDTRELGDLRSALRMAIRTARAVRRLHAAGLVHGDLSYRNVLLDPPRGDVCLIDLDGLVVPGKFPPEVIGTPDFIAPEVVATRHLERHDPQRKLPDWRTDLHALAVLIYQMLLLRHPLRGDQLHDLDNDERQETLLMGAGALFIENAHNAANRIDPAFLEPYEKPWKLTAQVPYTCLGPQLSSLIERAFVDGLHDPGLRPSALEWEDALVQTADLMHPCANSACPAGSFVVSARQLCCPFCDTHLPAPVLLAHSYFDRGGGAFAASGRIKILHHHAAVHSWHVRPEQVANEHANSAQAQRQAYLARADSQTWLINESIGDLRDIGAQNDIAPGQSVALKPGQKLLLSRANPAQLWLIDEIKAS